MHKLPKIIEPLAEIWPHSHLGLGSLTFHSSDLPCAQVWAPPGSPIALLSFVLASTLYVGPSWWGFLTLTGLLDHSCCPLPTDLGAVLCFLQWVSSYHMKQNDCHLPWQGLQSSLPESALCCDGWFSCGPCMILSLLGIGTSLCSGKRDGSLAWDECSNCVEIIPQYLIIGVACSHCRRKWKPVMSLLKFRDTTSRGLHENAWVKSTFSKWIIS